MIAANFYENLLFIFSIPRIAQSDDADRPGRESR